VEIGEEGAKHTSEMVHQENASKSVSIGTVCIINAAAYDMSPCLPPYAHPGPPCSPSLYSVTKKGKPASCANARAPSNFFAKQSGSFVSEQYPSEG
jgi:hypothetical protein